MRGSAYANAKSSDLLRRVLMNDVLRAAVTLNLKAAATVVLALALAGAGVTVVLDTLIPRLLEKARSSSARN